MARHEKLVFVVTYVGYSVRRNRQIKQSHRNSLTNKAKTKKILIVDLSCARFFPSCIHHCIPKKNRFKIPT